MRAWLLLPLLAISGSAVSGAVPLKTAIIPPAYRGEFSMRTKWCGDDDGDDEERVFVTATTVAMYEAERQVAKVTVTPQGLKIAFKPWPKEYEADGFNPEEGLQPPDELVLSKDGQVLNRLYRRCPVKRKH